ncbi:MAG: DUF3127 domain-containing protein [Alistipes ihumii]|uniref:DUF3127 domain-containing protein n=1 Tax=Alistipes ihumii TaxID=1470347 RepID=UPI00399C33C1
MELEGTVWNVLPPVRGTSARGEWVKQEVVFEQPGEFNRKVCVSFWGDKAQDAATLKPGEAVTISANVSRYGRWLQVRARRIVRKAAQQPQQAPVSDGLPPLDAFAEEPVASGSSSEVDDLPF